MKRGLFITFEGGEGSGKSSHSEKIYQALIKKGYPVLLTHEPGGTNISDEIRQILLTNHESSERPGILANTELFLYLASRAQHVDELIMPAIRAGKVVLCDRFSDTTMAYQGFARGIDKDFLKMVNNYVTHDLEPDYTILLDIDPEVGLERSRRMQKSYAPEGELDRMENQGLTFHKQVREGYLSVAESAPQRISVFDTNSSFDENNKSIMKAITQIIKDHGIQKHPRTRKN